ncbi:MAG: type II secretion protein [Nitrospirota bacterium]|nr:type II secretion protein [Nitrospirota bacterium]
MMKSDESKVAYEQDASSFRYRETLRYASLITYGVLTAEALRAAEESAAARGIETEGVLMREFSVPKRRLLDALSDYYHCSPIEYDERLPVPPELLSGLDGERLSLSQWFPVGKAGDTVTVAAANPRDPAVCKEISTYLKTETFEIRVALSEDIQWFILDFLHARPGHLVGTERTGLAFWRNTMAQWRTRLACYRNDMAKGRTALAFLRWGLGFIAVTNSLIRKLPLWRGAFFPWIIMGAGFLMASYGLGMYLRIRKSRLRPPGHHTLVEVTAATLQFLEGYHFIEDAGSGVPTKKTMLGRLGDFPADHCTILYPSPASKERTQLARERNVLAAQRTVAACYRTIYARARTGLAFIRTGVSFAGLGFGLMQYFGLSVFSLFDSVLVASGIFLIIDGFLWYLPVRKEQSEVPGCRVFQKAG